MFPIPRYPIFSNFLVRKDSPLYSFDKNKFGVETFCQINNN